MLKSLSTSLITRGILAVVVGIIALAWPSVTVLALVILFAIYAFMAAGLQAMRAFSSRKAGPVLGHLLLGLVDLAAGVIALAWPGPTALVLVLIVGVWAIIAGLAEIAAAFVHGQVGVGCQNCAAGCDPGFQAARSYSLRRPPRIGRRLTRSWERSATGWSGRGGWSSSARCGLRPL